MTQRGRPYHRDVKVRSQLSFMCNAETRAKIIKACMRNGRTMSQEVEHRVERSFYDEWIIERLRAELLPQGGGR